MQTINHQDGTQYRVDRRGTGRFYDLYFVYSIHGYFRVYAINAMEAINKARIEYAKRLTT